MVDEIHLRDFFKPLWGAETTGHPATCVIPANCVKAGPNRYPPFSDFFNDVMHTFSFYLLDLT